MSQNRLDFGSYDYVWRLTSTGGTPTVPPRPSTLVLDIVGSIDPLAELGHLG